MIFSRSSRAQAKPRDAIFSDERARMRTYMHRALLHRDAASISTASVLRPLELLMT